MEGGKVSRIERHYLVFEGLRTLGSRFVQGSAMQVSWSQGWYKGCSSEVGEGGGGAPGLP